MEVVLIRSPDVPDCDSTITNPRRPRGTMRLAPDAAEHDHGVTARAELRTWNGIFRQCHLPGWPAARLRASTAASALKAASPPLR
jgi:hypothetical protein